MPVTHKLGLGTILYRTIVIKKYIQGSTKRWALGFEKFLQKRSTFYCISVGRSCIEHSKCNEYPSNLHHEYVVADVLGDGEPDVGVGRDVLGEGEHFAESVGDGREELCDVGDRVGVVVVGDADPPQFDVLRYVPDGPFSDVDESISLFEHPKAPH